MIRLVLPTENLSEAGVTITQNVSTLNVVAEGDTGRDNVQREAWE